MEQDEGSRWREDQELLDFIYLITGFPLDCLCLQSSWARNSSNREYILRDMLLLQSMHTLRDRHTGASNREYTTHVLRDISLGARGSE